MGIATPILPSVTSHCKGHNSSQFHNFSNSMSQDYHQGVFSFSNGFERSPEEPQQQQHVTQQIRRDKLRVAGFEPPLPLVGIEEESSGLPVYESASMLSEMFNFPPGGGSTATATELLESQIFQSYRNSRAVPPPGGAAPADWFLHRQGMVLGGNLPDSKNQTGVDDTASAAHHHHHQISGINADSAAAMQLFMMNPQQQSSPSPPSRPPSSSTTSSTLHMLLPNPSSSSHTLQALQTSSGGAHDQFQWLPSTTTENNEIPRVVEGQGLSLSLSSSLQHLDASKAEEFRMGEGGMLFFGQGVTQYQIKNYGAGGGLHLQGGVSQNHQLQSGMGSSYGTVNLLRNSKYAKAALELLEEFCCVGRCQLTKNKFGNKKNENPNSNPSAGATSSGGAGGGNSSSSSKDIPPLSAADRLEHQRRKVKLLSMLDEVDRRYGHYCEQMQMVVNSFDMLMGFGAAVPYTSLAQKAMSWHFRCLKDAITAQLKHSCELLGEKDAGKGVTKGETPRLRILDQSLRQQRAFHQMGMMEQEAWRPQRGLPERAVNILRAWLFEHFLHPYPSDADKHLLARQAGLSRNQVSNWFINARVRLWKPMVEEMYQQEANEESGDDRDTEQATDTAQTSAPANTVISAPPPEINASKQSTTASMLTTAATMEHEADASGRGNVMESAVMRFGTISGDVSLTLGLRHAGNLPEKGSFSVRHFGGF